MHSFEEISDEDYEYPEDDSFEHDQYPDILDSDFGDDEYDEIYLEDDPFYPDDSDEWVEPDSVEGDGTVESETGTDGDT
jgi:hypothetical protein